MAGCVWASGPTCKIYMIHQKVLHESLCKVMLKLEATLEATMVFFTSTQAVQVELVGLQQSAVTATLVTMVPTSSTWYLIICASR